MSRLDKIVQDIDSTFPEGLEWKTAELIEVVKLIAQVAYLAGQNDQLEQDIKNIREALGK